MISFPYFIISTACYHLYKKYLILDIMYARRVQYHALRESTPHDTEPPVCKVSKIPHATDILSVAY